MLTHSYGGVPGGGAVHGLSKAMRTEHGKWGGVIGLVYLGASIIPESKSLVGWLGGQNAPYVSEIKASMGQFCVKK